MANNFNSDFNSTIPEQRSLFFLRCHSEHAQPCAIQDQDCQSLAIKTCTLHNHVLSLSSKYLNFYLLFFNSFPPFFPPSFLLNSLSDCMLSYLLYAEVFFLEWISFQAEVFCFTFWMNLLSSSFIATGKHFHCTTEAESLHCHTEANVFTATQIKLQLIIGLNHPRAHAFNQISAHNRIKPS